MRILRVAGQPPQVREQLLQVGQADPLAAFRVLQRRAPHLSYGRVRSSGRTAPTSAEASQSATDAAAQWASCATLRAVHQIGAVYPPDGGQPLIDLLVQLLLVGIGSSTHMDAGLLAVWLLSRCRLTGAT